MGTSYLKFCDEPYAVAQCRYHEGPHLKADKQINIEGEMWRIENKCKHNCIVQQHETDIYCIYFYITKIQ